MKKFVKITLFVVGGLLALVLLAALVVNLRGIPSYPTGNVELSVQADSAQLEQGRKIASALCVHCHSGANSPQLIGRRLEEDPALGVVYSANITQHPEAGIGGWTDGELKYFLRTGIKRDGSFCPPPMIRLPNMSDDDIDALIAFLRSDAPILQASETAMPPSKPSFLLKALTQFVIKPHPYPEAVITKPAPSDQLAYGKYLVNDQLLCYACHSANIQTINELKPEHSPGYLGGGTLMATDDGDPIYTANISSDPETGIGNWTYEQFYTLMKEGRKPDGRMIQTPMLPYSYLEDWEIEAIFSYLMRAPAVSNAVDRKVPAAVASAE